MVVLDKPVTAKVNFAPDMKAVLFSDNMETVSVKLANGEMEMVQVDPTTGPVQYTNDGRQDYALFVPNLPGGGTGHWNWKHAKAWKNLGATEREVLIHTVAKRNRARRDRFSVTGMPPKQDNPFTHWEYKWFDREM
mmetsp:Transcript_61737/g.108131  ORF Transcript_61737/g.108131 Transcript_61737/m.108131 type:complete len:136 (-) Transcript_61737:169-576(-)